MSVDYFFCVVFHYWLAVEEKREREKLLFDFLLDLATRNIFLRFIEVVVVE